MKQKTLWVCLTLFSLSVLAISPLMAQQGAVDEEFYEDTVYDDEPYISENGYTYDDAYSSVNWDSLNRDRLYYSYYQNENVFMVVVGRRIYIMPYDYFYYRVWPYQRARFSYCNYNYFSDWWGVPFYNRIWYGYHRHHYSSYNHRYNRRYDFYRDHHRRPRVVVHKEGWRSPRTMNRTINRSRVSNSNQVLRTNRISTRSSGSQLRSNRSNSQSVRRTIRPRNGDSNRDMRKSSSSRTNRSASSSSRSSSSSSRSSVRSRSSSSSHNSSSSRSNSGSSSRGTAVRKR